MFLTDRGFTTMNVVEVIDPKIENEFNIPSKRDLVLLLTYYAPENTQNTTTRIQKLTYLFGNYLRMNYGWSEGYEFSDVIGHTGPYDELLTKNIDDWLLIGCLSYYEEKEQGFSFHDIRTSRSGDIYCNEEAIGKFKLYLGNEEYKKFIELIKKYNLKTELELIQMANELKT